MPNCLSPRAREASPSFGCVSPRFSTWFIAAIRALLIAGSMFARFVLADDDEMLPTAGIRAREAIRYVGEVCAVKGHVISIDGSDMGKRLSMDAGPSSSFSAILLREVYEELIAFVSADQIKTGTFWVTGKIYLNDGAAVTVSSIKNIGRINPSLGGAATDECIGKDAVGFGIVKSIESDSRNVTVRWEPDRTDSNVYDIVIPENL